MQRDLGIRDTDEAPGPNIRPLRVIPGGANAIPEEWYAAAILLGALAGLWAVRRKLGNEGRTMASGTAGIVFVFYFLIASALLKIVAYRLADHDTPIARAVGFFAS